MKSSQKTFEVIFIKNQLIKGLSTIPIMAKQTIYAFDSTITIPVPEGYSILSVTEQLPYITIEKNESIKNSNLRIKE